MCIKILKEILLFVYIELFIGRNQDMILCN